MRYFPISAELFLQRARGVDYALLDEMPLLRDPPTDADAFRISRQTVNEVPTPPTPSLSRQQRRAAERHARKRSRL